MAIAYAAQQAVSYYVGSALLGAAVGAAVSYAGSALVSKDSGSVEQAALNTSVRQPAAARRLIYGQVKTGGVLVYPGQKLDGDAHLVIALGEGQVESIDSVYWLAESLSTDEKFAGLLHMEWFDGHPDQTACMSLVNAIPDEWTVDHRLRGVAYAYVRMKFDRNAFPRGLVFPTFKIKGRKIYDPRTGATAWSENPALCVLDYLRSVYSVQCPDDMIDFGSFIAAANICDELVESADPANVEDGVPGRVKRYTLNGVFEASSSPVPVIETMEGSCAGKLVFTQGKYRFYAGAYRHPSADDVLTAEYLRDDPTFRAHVGRQQRVNIARGTYREPRQDWQETDFAAQELPAAVIAEAGEIVENYKFDATTNGATAQRLAKLRMLQARGKTPLVLRCNWAALRWRLWDVVTVNLPEIDETGRTWCVIDYTFAEGGGIDLTLVPDEAWHYEWNAATDEVLVKDVPTPDFNSTPPPVTGLVVAGEMTTEGESTTPVPAISARWDKTADAFMEHYEVQVKSVLDADWDDATSGTTKTANFTSTSVVAGEEYDLRVRIERGDGTYGEWTEDLATLIKGDDIDPNPPTNLSVTGTGTVSVNWKTPDGRDFRKSNVYTNSVNSPLGATLLDTITGAPLTLTTKTHTPGSLTYYFVSAQDATGNESALTYAGSGT
jgi:hypothetical protein